MEIRHEKVRSRKRITAIVAIGVALGVVAPTAVLAACGYIGGGNLIVGVARFQIGNGPTFVGYANDFLGSTQPAELWIGNNHQVAYMNTNDHYTMSVATYVADTTTSHCTMGFIDLELSAKQMNCQAPTVGGPWVSTLNVNTCIPGDSFYKSLGELSHFWLGHSPAYEHKILLWDGGGNFITGDDGCHHISNNNPQACSF
jgi:hypothetical protein